LSRRRKLIRSPLATRIDCYVAIVPISTYQDYPITQDSRLASLSHVSTLDWEKRTDSLIATKQNKKGWQDYGSIISLRRLHTDIIKSSKERCLTYLLTVESISSRLSENTFFETPLDKITKPIIVLQSTTWHPPSCTNSAPERLLRRCLSLGLPLEFLM
jgi:hypothetical protein